MKIKTTKKLNLPELIQHVWENKVYPSRFVPEEFGTTRYVEFSDGGMFRTGHGLHENDTFTVEVEEELTEDTVLDRVIVVGDVFGTPYSDVVTGISISEIISNDIGANHKTKTIYHLSGNYIATHIWTEEHSVPEEGTLEVDAE